MPRLKIIQFHVDKMGPWDRQDFSTVLLFPVLQLHSIPGDLTREEDANKVVDAAVEKFGTIHILVRIADIAVVYTNPTTPVEFAATPLNTGCRLTASRAGCCDNFNVLKLSQQPIEAVKRVPCLII